jgi:SecD/SecF fusion protein
MQNKSILWIFVILLSLAVAYQLSFSFFASRYETTIKELAKDSLDRAGFTEDKPGYSTALADLYAKALKDSSNAEAYPVFGTTYSDLRAKQLNLGLDLKGGMSATLEVSIPDLLIALSGDNTDATFRKSIQDAKEARKSSTSDFITLFEAAWNKNNTSKLELWRIFDNMDNKGMFAPNSSDDDVLDILRKEANDAIDNTEKIILKRIDATGIAQATVQKQSMTGRIIVEIPGITNGAEIRNRLKATANLEFWDTYRTDDFLGKLMEVYSSIGKLTAPDLYSQDPMQPQKDSLMSVALKAEGLSQAQKDSIINVYKDPNVKPDSLLSETDKARKYPLRKLQLNFQSKSAVAGYAAVSDTAEINTYLNKAESRNILPGDLRLMWSSRPQDNIAVLYAIRDESMRGKAELDGRSIVNAYQDFDPFTGEVIASMSMNSDGSAIWREMTRKNAADSNRPIAIVMDGQVITAPNVNGEIPNGSSQITFGSANTNESMKEAQELVALLKAGSLPAPSRIINEQIVGPTLGKANIQSGIISFIAAFIAILLFMIFYYAWAGFAANIALIANLFFLIGALVSFEGALTLPGIAGIVLTMGMAVDANVLIYERVKEELRLGKGISAAMKDGFVKALGAIIDGNVTTFITGLVLFFFGSGPIRGFATTLLIGIFTTLFTALLISRLILYRRLENKKQITFYSNITKDWFTNMNYDFVAKRKMFYGLSIAIIAAGIVSMFVRDNAFDYGVDFAGGTTARVTFNQPVDEDALRASLKETLVYEGQTATSTVQRIDNDKSAYKVTTDFMISAEVDSVENKIYGKMDEAFTKVSSKDGYVIEDNFKVDPTMTDDFRKEAALSGIIALICVGIYIFIRFQKWDFALGASVALLHDALIVIAAFSLLYGILPISLEVNQNFIGAILTVIGYSINDTVVIFDRIREYLKVRKNAPIENTINDALNSTFGRSINTSFTVLLTLVIMFIFGSDDIRGFCFAMIIGVISGVYSTLFIASPIVVDMRKWSSKKDDVDAPALAKA